MTTDKKSSPSTVLGNKPLNSHEEQEQTKQDELISWSQFQQVKLCVGTIVAVEDFPEARKPAYKLQVDFGATIGLRKSSAQITSLYEKQELIGKQVVAVINFPKKQIGPVMSECLVTGFYRDNGDVVLAVPDKPVANGQLLG